MIKNVLRGFQGYSEKNSGEKTASDGEAYLILRRQDRRL